MSDSYQPEDYAQYRINRAKDTLLEVEVLFENGFWNACINRMYLFNG